MENQKEQENINACIKRFRESITAAFDDMAEDLELDVRLEDGEVLYCEKCHLVALGPDDLKIKSNCKASNTSEHDFVVIENLSENIVYVCTDCQKYWFSFKTDPNDLQKEACEKSKSGMHSIRTLSYLCGHPKVKPVVPKEMVISIKESDRELSPVEFHIGSAKVGI